jgi:hypothetical protein
MHLEAVIIRTWRLCSAEFGDALGDLDPVNSQMHREAMIKRVWRYTWKP